MEYGKPFGVGASGSVAAFGVSVGYGWIVLVSLGVTIVCIAAIRRYFRSGKHIGKR